MSLALPPRCNRRRWGQVLAVAAAAVAGGAACAQMPAREQQRIEQLLRALEREPSLRFDRNGTRVGGADAARFLRAKWARSTPPVDTAEAFIEQIGSRSSTSGRAYRVCTSESRCVEAGPWLREQLERLDKPRP